MDTPQGFGAYATELGRWETPELQNAAKAMVDLQTHPGWAVLKQLAEYRQRLVLAKTDPPTVHAQAEYALWHGMRSGIQQIVDCPQAVVHAARAREREQAAKLAAAQEA